MEIICHHEYPKPAKFVVAGLSLPIPQVTVHHTKAKAGNNTSQARPDISADMVSSGKSFAHVF